MATTPSHVLLVEDNEGYSYLTKRLLLDINARLVVRVARDGQEALALLGQQPADLILLDLVMPTVSGLELLAVLKGDVNTARVPVVVLSGYRDDQRVREAYQRFANAFLLKPDDPGDLRASLAALNDFWFLHALLPPRTLSAPVGP